VTQTDAPVQAVNGVVVQGRATAGEWVTTLSIAYSQDGYVWTAVGVFSANSNSYTRAILVFPSAVSARYLKLVPLTFNSWPSLRWNALVWASPCSTCLPGAYSLGISVSTCVACAAAPANAYFPAPGCGWLCNVGFFRNPTCTRCLDSSRCGAGQYRPNCTGGLLNDQGCTGSCTTKQQTQQAVYLGPSSDNSDSGCPWACNAGYFKDMIQSCTACPPPCGTGLYASAACVPLSSVAMVLPTCVPCLLPGSSTAWGAGTVPGNASSCPYTCNPGYYGQACLPWTAVCNPGYNWTAGTNTSDATCKACPYAGVYGYYFYITNLCSYYCTPGVGLSNATCQQCAAGKYKDSTSAAACAVCPQNTYQNSPGQSACIQVPANGLGNAGLTNFVCNGGYMRVYAMAPLTLLDTCGACPGNPVLNSLSVAWSACSVTSLACNPGYYLNWSALLLCVGCGLQPPANSVWAPYNASAVCPACTALQDRQVSCPFACNAGYYSQGFGCVRCATVTCSGGLYAQLCTGQVTFDSCLVCPYQLSGSRQMWVAQCQWQCLAGFWLQADACVTCSAGFFKASVGNQTCSGCGLGSCALSAISCIQCPPGTYSALSAASACLQCPFGTIAPLSNSSACRACPTGMWPQLYASSSGTSCLQCTWATPTAASPGGPCTNPAPPCPAGYYLPFSSAACLLCPQGTYCAMGSRQLFCTTSATTSVPATSVSDCTGPSLLVGTCGANLAGLYQCVPNAGFYGHSAAVCPYDAYCPQGSLMPLLCPAGFFAPLNSWSLSHCTISMQPPCRPGYFVPFDSSSCNACPAGCYCPDGPSVLACPLPATNFSSSPLSTSASQCVWGLCTSSSCPPNTQGPGPCLLQCRANAGYYYTPGTGASALCPPFAYYCPTGSVVPLPCPPTVTSCPQLGQYPTQPSLCPLAGTVSPTPTCQNCTGLPTFAYWTSYTDGACPFCCPANYYRYSSSTCNPQPSNLTCPVGQYVPPTPACFTSVQPCVSCPLPPSNQGFLNFTSVMPCTNMGCSPGFYLLNAICQPCPAGYSKFWPGNSTQCDQCADGT
jgi:hypothetical protein